MALYDYIIIGAGSAGCVLADRLGHDQRLSVLVLEAGTPDLSFLLKMPAGFAGPRPGDRPTIGAIRPRRR